MRVNDLSKKKRLNSGALVGSVCARSSTALAGEQGGPDVVAFTERLGLRFQQIALRLRPTAGHSRFAPAKRK